MGYYSYLTGEMTFSRSLKRDEATKARPPESDPWQFYKLTEEKETRETYEGTLTITRVTGTELIHTDQVKAYEWESRLRMIVEKLPDDVTVSGYFERIGEEQPDMERLYVKGREVVSVRPTIMWPEP